MKKRKPLSKESKKEYDRLRYRTKKNERKKERQAIYLTPTETWSKAYYQKNRERIILNNRKIRLKIRRIVLQHYSPELKCQRCGFSDIRALSIDHINGGGRSHERELNARGEALTRWIRKNNYPQGFQVLCMNCQFIKRIENQEHYKKASYETKI